MTVALFPAASSRDGESMMEDTGQVLGRGYLPPCENALPESSEPCNASRRIIDQPPTYPLQSCLKSALYDEKHQKLQVGVNPMLYVRESNQRHAGKLPAAPTHVKPGLSNLRPPICLASQSAGVILAVTQLSRRTRQLHVAALLRGRALLSNTPLSFLSQTKNPT